MAMTASIALDSNSVKVNKLVTATVTVSNSGASAINVIGVVPVISYTGGNYVDSSAANVGLPAVSAGINVSVPASGTLKIPFGVVLFAPSTGFLGGSGTYDVGCVCQSSDGSIFSPTAATLTVAVYP